MPGKRAGFLRKLASAFLAFAACRLLGAKRRLGRGGCARVPAHRRTLPLRRGFSSAGGETHPAGEGAAAPVESADASDASNEETIPSVESPNAMRRRAALPPQETRRANPPRRRRGFRPTHRPTTRKARRGFPRRSRADPRKPRRSRRMRRALRFRRRLRLSDAMRRAPGQTWAAPRSYTLDADASVADVTEAMFAACGIEASVFAPSSGSSWQVNSITSPFDGDIVLEADFDTGEEWHVFVNGVEVDQYDPYLHKRVLSEGDAVVWFYSAPGEEPPAAEAFRLPLFGGAGCDAASAQTWLPETAISCRRAPRRPISPRRCSRRRASRPTSSLPRAQGYWMLNEVTSPFDPDVRLSWDAQTGAFWQLFVNGDDGECGRRCPRASAGRRGDVVLWCRRGASRTGEGVPCR